MTDEAPPEGQSETPQDNDDAQPQEGSLDALPPWAREALTKANKEAASYRTKAQANAQAAKELEAFKQATMSETEKAIAEAKAEGRMEALREGGGKLVAAEIRAAAAGRLTQKQLDALLDGTNLAAFVDDDGEVDRAKVSKYVEGIAPAEAPRNSGFPDLGQGARGTNGGGDMNAMIRRQLGRS